MSKTIIVSNRLPVKITSENGEYALSPSEGGLATGLGSVYSQGNNIWIGWPGMEITDNNERTTITGKLKSSNLVPVFLSSDEIALYYQGFSNETLWPIFHYLSTYARYEQSYWDTYKEVNQKFCDVIIQYIEPGDSIWIHDYQLLLLPGMLRKIQQDISIGFFLHIPFPSYELFRLIPWRNELLEGIMGSDLIGFHTFDDSRHFISSATRILPLYSSSNTIIYNDRPVVIESFPMGIDYKKFEDLTYDPKIRQQALALKENFSTQKMILSIDRLDYSKGILQRLQAFDLFLKEYPQYIEKVNLYMIVVPSRDSVPQYMELHDEIDKLVGNINARYRTLNWHPISYFYRSFPIEILSALYYAADICLVTPMRDGMNLVCKEFLASRTNNDGVLILSEMAGASKELTDALIVNPNDIGAICRAIHQGLTMSPEEQSRRMKQMRQTVAKFNIHHWVRLFMAGLKETKLKQEAMRTKLIGAKTEDAIIQRYTQSGKRILYLDYDGTLVGFHNNIEQAAPDEELYNLLNHLADNPGNEIVLVSGRNHNNLETWFGHMPIDMIAEHGAWRKMKHSAWEQIPGLNDNWKQEVAEVMDMYTDRTPGSFIEEKSFSLAWHYRKVEKGLGEMRATELINNLSYLIQDKGLQLLPGNKVIEIKNIDINKGKAALTRLQEDHYDFILALGDDHTDEDIFKALPEKAITIKVGSNISAAKFYLRNHIEVRNFLQHLDLSIALS
jgi:trehalose 6-phosphate synthase/phosphatase